MKKTIEAVEEEQGPELNGYRLVNAEKANRAIYGAVVDKGQLVGGVGEGASNEAIIAEYDRLGGLIKKGKLRVKMGSFYDFKGRKPRATPEVAFVFRDLEGDEVVIAENEEIPLEVKAADIAAQNRSERAVKALAKSKGKKKRPVADDADEE